MEDEIFYDEKGRIRFKEGTQECGKCHTKENVIQFERHIKRKGLPIIEIAFLCKSCAEKERLIEDSKEITTL